MLTTSRWAPYLFVAFRIGVGLLFFQHGAEKMWGFAGGKIETDYTAERAIGGLLETVGGGLIALGLFTRPAAFIVCGEMAVVYFTRWAPRGFWPISNGGEESVLFCFAFLYLVFAGSGPWSVDGLIGRPSLRAPRGVTQ